MNSDKSTAKSPFGFEGIDSSEEVINNLRALFPVIISSFSTRKILYVNQVAADCVGLEIEDAIGFDTIKLWKSRHSFTSFVHRLKRDGCVKDFEAQMTMTAGETRHVLLTAFLTPCNNEKAVYTVVTDITAQKLLEAEMLRNRKDQQKLYGLMNMISNNVPDLIWAKDLDDRYIYTNKAIRERLLGCAENDDPTGKNDIFFAKRERQRGYTHTFGEICINSDQVVKDTLKPGRFLEDGMVRNTYLALDVHKAPFFDQEGLLIGTVGAGRDVTKDFEIQETLRKNEARFRFLAENVRDVIWTTDGDLKLTYITPSVLELTGYTADEFIVLPREKHFSPNFGRMFAVVSRYLQQKAKKGFLETQLWEFEWTHRDGHLLWIETSTSPFFNDNDEFDGFVCVSRETTQKMQAQFELQKAKEEALSASKAKSEFLANMSHEIRTPLNGVLGMLQLMQKTQLCKEQTEYVETAISSGNSLLKIISDILDFSKIEAGRIDLEHRNFRLHEIFETIIASFQSMVDQHRVRLQANIVDNLPTLVTGDETRFRQILFNIIGNAVKFTEDGSITVSVSHTTDEKETELLVEIIDTGIGIDSSKIESLFEPFVQIDGSYHRKHSGTGLGLSIVKQLLGFMKGDIAISSDHGLGTHVAFTVIFELPTDADATDNLIINTEKTAVTVLGPLNLLVVEDEHINAIVVTSMLKKLGHRTTLADNGYSALQILENQRFDGIFMDIQMPRMDGIETAAAIRNLPHENREIPIIALTAHAMKGDKERFLEAGMNDYLTKPIEIKSLTTILRKLKACKGSAKG